jgi:hypothetical protein
VKSLEIVPAICTDKTNRKLTNLDAPLSKIKLETYNYIAIEGWSRK